MAPEPIMMRCPECGASNRVSRERLVRGSQAVCGRCRSPLPVGAQPLVVTDDSFRDQVERSPLPVLLDLWAPWCGPCRMVGPVVEQLASEMAGRLRVVKMNVDENPITAGRFRVQSIPTLLVLQDGREIDRIIGAQSKSEIAARLSRVLLTWG